MDRFFVGFVIGATVNAAVVLVFTPASGEEMRRGIVAHIRGALAAGRAAATAREQELWAEFHRRLEENQRRLLGSPPPREGGDDA